MTVGALGEEMADEWIRGQFEIPELAVVPERQGRRLGTRLLESLLSGLPHRRAWLVTAADNERAAGFYRARGWEILAEARVGLTVPRIVFAKRARRGRSGVGSADRPGLRKGSVSDRRESLCRLRLCATVNALSL